MSEFTINEMKEMQKNTTRKIQRQMGRYFCWSGAKQITMDGWEIGEVIDIVKKHSGLKASQDEDLRKDLIEELADVLMYYNDVLLC